ncbi:MAG TPA: EamA family transporter [Bacillota bacterium]|nr:EamA family transporter [Bacillota bacterium]
MKDGKVLGFACAVSSSTIWGLTIIYWKALVPIDSIVIMLYRIVLVSITMLFVNLKVFNRKELVETLKSKENIKAYLLGGILISASWAINIWGVNSNEILQTSLGFYLEPLIIAAIGLLFFKERFTKLILISFLFALIGVGGMIISYGKIPMFALSLAGTYAAYAVIKRNTNSDFYGFVL